MKESPSLLGDSKGFADTRGAGVRQAPALSPRGLEARSAELAAQLANVDVDDLPIGGRVRVAVHGGHELIAGDVCSRATAPETRQDKRFTRLNGQPDYCRWRDLGSGFGF